MRLNHDCTRDVLLYLESTLVYSPSGKLVTNLHGRDLVNVPQLSHYSAEDIYYSCSQLFQNKFIAIKDKRWAKTPSHYRFVDITPAGHKYLESVREPAIWRLLKEKFGDISIMLLPDLAQKAFAELPELLKSLPQLPLQ